MKSNNIKITIITITYNLKRAGRENTFRQCVESVHNQTYKNIEHIVVDGASTDGSLDLIKEYAKKGWITYISEPDSGVYDAMNKGLNLATGDYIAFLNSDDYYHDKKGIQTVVKFILSKKPDFCYGTCNYITESGDFYGVLKPVVGSFFVRMPFSHQTLFVNTKLMRKLGGFDAKNFKSAGDYDFIIRLYLSGAKGYKFNTNFVNYRMGGLSDVQREQSESECVKSFVKNYAKMDKTIDYKKMFLYFTTTKTLINNIKKRVCKDVCNEIDEVISRSERCEGDFIRISEYPSVVVKQASSSRKNIYLFDLIPLLKIKHGYGVKRYLLFHFLPVLKVKFEQYKTKSYFFDFIPFTNMSDRYGVYKLRIFGIPVLKIKG